MKILRRKYAVVAVSARDGYVLGEADRFFTRRGAERFMRHMNVLRLGWNYLKFTYVVKSTEAKDDD